MSYKRSKDKSPEQAEDSVDNVMRVLQSVWARDLLFGSPLSVNTKLLECPWCGAALLRDDENMLLFHEVPECVSFKRRVEASGCAVVAEDRVIVMIEFKGGKRQDN